MATRLYFPADTAAPVSPTVDAAWQYTTGYVSRYLADVKGSSTIANGTLIGAWTLGYTALDRQYVSAEMNAGIEFSTSVTVKGQLVVREDANADDVNQMILGIRIVSSDGGTVRRTILTVGAYGTAAEFAFSSAGRNKKLADGDALNPTSSYTTVQGDRLVVEIGYKDATTGSTPRAQGKYGENGTDLPEDETTTSGAGWIEFSNTITWYSPVTSPAPWLPQNPVPGVIAAIVFVQAIAQAAPVQPTPAALPYWEPRCPPAPRIKVVVTPQNIANPIPTVAETPVSQTADGVLEAIGLIAQEWIGALEAQSPVSQAGSGALEAQNPVSQSGDGAIEAQSPVSQPGDGTLEAQGEVSQSGEGVIEALGVIPVSQTADGAMEASGLISKSADGAVESSSPVAQSGDGLVESSSPVSQVGDGAIEALQCVSATADGLLEATGALPPPPFPRVTIPGQRDSWIYPQTTADLIPAIPETAVSQTASGLIEATSTWESTISQWSPTAPYPALRKVVVRVQEIAAPAQDYGGLIVLQLPQYRYKAQPRKYLIQESAAPIPTLGGATPVSNTADGVFESRGPVEQSAGGGVESLNPISKTSDGAIESLSPVSGEASETIESLQGVSAEASGLIEATSAWENTIARWGPTAPNVAWRKVITRVQEYAAPIPAIIRIVYIQLPQPRFKPPSRRHLIQECAAPLPAIAGAVSQTAAGVLEAWGPISQSAVGALESLVSTSQQASDALEALSSPSQQASGAIEALGLVEQSASGVIEALGAIAVSNTADGVLEAWGPVQQTADGSLEARGLVSYESASTLEAVLPASSSAAGAVEALLSASQYAGGTLESRGFIDSQAVGAIEARGQIEKQAAGAVESLSSLEAGVASAVEALLRIPSSVDGAIEAVRATIDVENACGSCFESLFPMSRPIIVNYEGWGELIDQELVGNVFVRAKTYDPNKDLLISLKI